MDCWGSFQVPGPLDLDCELDNDWNTIQLEEVQRRARAGLCGFLDRLMPGSEWVSARREPGG